MAKRDLTNTQRKVADRYYQNKDAIMATKLAELVTELYLCTDDRKTTRLWERALKALANTNVKPERIDAIVDARDVEQLARLVGELA